MKLHPLSIPYRIAQASLGLLWVPFVAVFAVGAIADGALAVVLFGVVVIGGLAAVAGWQIAYYRRYEYELTEDTFDIGSGVFSRTEREVPYGRIQNVTINRNVVQRVLGLAEVRIETAGGSGSEAHLRYVSQEEGRRLQDELSERKRRDEPSESAVEGVEEATVGRESEQDTDHAERMFEIQGKELVVLGVVALDTRVIPLVLFGVASFFPTIMGWVEGTVGSGVLLVPVAVVGLYLITAAISAARSVTNYYGFTLFRGDDELRYERGLINRYSGTIPLSKVQAVTITENPLARLTGYASLDVETAGYSPGEAGGSEAAVPIAKRDRVLELAHDIEPVELPEFERPPKRARERYFFRYLGLLGIFTGVVYAGVLGGLWGVRWWLFLAALPLVPVAAHCKWKHLGYALTDDHAITRKGFWSRSTKVVPYHRIQTVVDTQTIFQRRRRLATLTVDIAGSRSLVGDDSQAVDIDRDVADDLREEIADRLLSSLEEDNRARRQRLRERRRRLSSDLGTVDRGTDATADGAAVPESPTSATDGSSTATDAGAGTDDSTATDASATTDHPLAADPSDGPTDDATETDAVEDGDSDDDDGTNDGRSASVDSSER